MHSLHRNGTLRYHGAYPVKRRRRERHYIPALPIVPAIPSYEGGVSK